MHKLLLSSGLIVLGLASCSPSPDGPWQRAAVTAYLQDTLHVPAASYEPLRWSQVETWRLNRVAQDDLPLARQRLQGVAAELAHDSAGYALVARTAAQFGTSPADVALVKRRYLTGVRYRDSTRAEFRQLVASQRDTAVAFYRLTHTYRFRNEQGQRVVDSAAFNVGKQGQVVPLYFHRISPPVPAAPRDALAPPPPDMKDVKIQYY